ncbi:hypothetical protein FRC05_007676 [Tulasnella sp. 425]|nr:hypothetical protein FRC05_007676 [Tulasnella sp. 425]
MALFRAGSNSTQRSTPVYDSGRSTPSEFSAWGIYPETTRFPNWPRPQVGSSSNHPPPSSHTAPTNVAGPSNSRPWGQSGNGHSVQSNREHSDHGGDGHSIEEDSGPSGSDESSDTSSDESSDQSSDEEPDPSNDDDPVPSSDEDPDQNSGEEDGQEIDAEAALDAIRKKLNSCIVVGAKNELNAYQKLARRRTFDLEMSEAQEAAPKDEDSMVLEILCRVHDSKYIQEEEGPTLIVVSNQGQLDKWAFAAREFSERFLDGVVAYYGPRRSEGNGLLKNGLEFLRVILVGGEVIRNRKTQQSQACLAVNASYHWCCTKDSSTIAFNQYEVFAEFLRIPNLTAARRSKEFLDQFILLPPDDNSVYQTTTFTSQLDDRFLLFEGVNFDRGQWEFYEALEERLNDVGGRHLRPRALQRGGGDIVRKMILFLLRACCHLDLVLGDPDAEIQDQGDDGRECIICQESINLGNNSQYCTSCNEEVMSFSPERSARFANPKIRKMLGILRRIEEISDRPGKTVIVCQFDDFADIIAGYLTREEFQFVRCHDSNIMQKERAMKTLRSPLNPARVALVTVNLADIHGLDLRRFSRVILMDLPWDPRLDARRFLVDHDVRVNIYQLYFAHSIERRALELLYRPQPISDNTQDIIQQLGVRSTPSNLDFLLQPT